MQKAPNFELFHIQSEEKFELNKNLGQVVVLTFWTSWCPDCGTDLPKKEQLYQNIDPNKVAMITINVSGRERHDVAGIEFANKFLTQPTLVDQGVSTYQLYEAQGVPTTVIINQEGYITHQFGDQSSFYDIVRALGTLI
ncbi:TlpA family protein disulfide reductase [Halobacillus seohaensis]|uniref:TlpA family protein disulfide reductase n=2 Tax=Halobacillus seohaensis TaxID=447421 RepID=A0ABW2EU95_9BACI